jgi:N-acetylglutamate synthase-like GNAT family acetyltransferase
VEEVRYRGATPADEAAVRALLDAAGLPTRDLAAGRQEMILAVHGEELAGCVGLEARGPAGLLRSLAVAPAFRGRGIARELCRRVLSLARERGLPELYLLTTTIEPLCRKLGFERVDRAAVPPEVAGSEEFRALCPASATCMTMRVGPASGH